MTTLPVNLLKARWVAAKDQTEAAAVAYTQAVASPYRRGDEVTALLDEWMTAQIRQANAHIEYLRAGGDS